MVKFKFEHTFEAYERWRHSLENDIMWRQMAGEKNRWSVNGKLIFDSNGHAINHCGYDLLKAVLEKMDLSSIEPNGQIEDTVFFDHPIGYHECVETTESDKIIYLQRLGRARVTRFVLDRVPEPCNSVFVVIGRVADTNRFVFRTAFVGSKSAREPWDKNANREDVQFWKHHALIAPRGADLYDDLGDGGYWEKIVCEEEI